MTIEETYKLVEDVLKYFPEECRKNYEENKKDVTITKENESKIGLWGEYDHEKNIITIYKEESLPHELFHMAFRDRNKLNKQLFEDAKLIYDNGVAYKDKGVSNRFGNSLTEGFTEYLARKCSLMKGHNLEYYFVNLLIKIHGEDILMYPLTNDSLNFYQDSRFTNIHDIRKELDLLITSEKSIKLFVAFQYIFLEKLKNNEDVKETYGIMLNVKNDYVGSIERVFNLMISEYENCYNSKICLNDFIDLLNDFIINEDYQVAFKFDEEYQLKEKIEEIINNFKLRYVKENKKMK